MEILYLFIYHICTACVMTMLWSYFQTSWVLTKCNQNWTGWRINEEKESIRTNRRITKPYQNKTVKYSVWMLHHENPTIKTCSKFMSTSSHWIFCSTPIPSEFSSGGGYKDAKSSAWFTISLSSGSGRRLGLYFKVKISLTKGAQILWQWPGCHWTSAICRSDSGLGKRLKARGSSRVKCTSKHGRCLPTSHLQGLRARGPGELKAAPSASM